ncbi:hypothetical protein F5887DRAFT_869282, partial [Amanita rubescens]
YFFWLQFGEIRHTVAVISVFSSPDTQLLQESHHVVHACHYQGDSKLVVCNVKCIKSLVAMVPY